MASFRDIFDCLVHESLECVVDLVRKLRYLDRDLVVLLFNGGFPCEEYGALANPQTRRRTLMRLHIFTLDCLHLTLDHLPFETLTIEVAS